jgi:hypothetical protein
MELQSAAWQEPPVQDASDWWPYRGEFPHWQVWRGICGLVYARRMRPDRAGLVCGEDPVDLRDQIRRVEISD